MMQAAAASGGKDADIAALPAIEGLFALISDGAILANNTDSGPHGVAQGQRLDWTINLRSAAAPAALIRLAD